MLKVTIITTFERYFEYCDTKSGPECIYPRVSVDHFLANSSIRRPAHGASDHLTLHVQRALDHIAEYSYSALRAWLQNLPDVVMCLARQGCSVSGRVELAATSVAATLAAPGDEWPDDDSAYNFGMLVELVTFLSLLWCRPTSSAPVTE